MTAHSSTEAIVTHIPTKRPKVSRPSPNVTIQLHGVTACLLDRLALSLGITTPALCQEVVMQYSSHPVFTKLVEHVKTLPEYQNQFHPHPSGAHSLTINRDKCERQGVKDIRSNQDWAAHAADVLTAYGVGISRQGDLRLRDLPVDVQLSFFTIKLERS